jgi:hypothetical protein
VAVAVLTISSFGFACSAEAPETRPTAACKLPPEIEIPKDIPADFPWPDGVFVAQAEKSKQFVSIGGYGEQTVEELFEVMRDELSDKEFDLINTDYEGFEAELYFAKGDSLAGIAALREGPCDGYVKVNVVYDPLETAAGREAVRKTRRLTGEGSTPDG